ncbi:MAG: hypothetical protein JOS17DRAFT_80293 [Linnemannia elongata]|nr:MAG: hypothetical protein JOS17DRAFT_80293 [Linnemannia elongata]
MPLGMLDGDDDDDFDSLTPRSIRLRSPTPPPKRPAPVSSSQHQRRPRQEQQQQQQQQQQSHTQQQSQQRQQQKHDQSQSTHNLKRPQSDRSQGLSRPTSSQTPITAAPSTSKPRTGLPLSLKKPAPKSNPSSQVTPPQTNEVTTQSTMTYSTATVTPPRRLTKNSPKAREAAGKEAVMIVLDSESEGGSDIDSDRLIIPSTVFPEIALGSTQIGGVLSTQPLSRTSSAQNHKRTTPIMKPCTQAHNTQESVASSQGSVGHCQEPDQLDNCFPVDKDPNPRSPTPVNQLDTRMDYAQDSEVQWSLSPKVKNPHLSDLVAATTISSSTSAESASSTTAPRSAEPIVVDDDDSNTYTHTTTSSINISITDTMQTDDCLPSTLGGDDIVECVVCGKPLTHLDSARVEYHINNCIDEQQQQQKQEQQADRLRTPTSHGEFAGAKVDYLAKVKKCPICKLDWPSKGKAKAKTVTPIRKARQKVEHMKRCAKANKRTIQSVLYQVRLLKERFERSLVLGTPMESASQDVERELKSDEEERSSDETNPEESQPKVRRKPKVNIMVKKQVVSLADSADVDFASDAIITTVNAPTVAQSRLTKLERIHQDQHDDGLQMALAISMSMCDNDSGSHSTAPGPSTTWTMAPVVLRKGVKRRKQTERDRNETTVLPFSEVQHLIQNNVHSLLFPEVDNTAVTGGSGDDESSTAVLMKTPPWGPSRFTGYAEDADVEINLSQTSEQSATSPSKSLWNLSHLKDTHGGDSLEDATMRGVREASVALVQAGSGLPFDKEKYVTRFMRRYIRQDQDAREGSKSAEPVSPEQESSKVI